MYRVGAHSRHCLVGTWAALRVSMPCSGLCSTERPERALLQLSEGAALAPRPEAVCTARRTFSWREAREAVMSEVYRIAQGLLC